MKRLLAKSAKSNLHAVALLLTASIILNGCGIANASASATETAICEELRRDLPTWSRADTPETLKAGARFIGVFNAVCP